MPHCYKVGQMLDLHSASRHRNGPSGPCEVLFCLPHDKGPVLYRVKSRGESYDRVVAETDLSPSSSTARPVFADSGSVFKIAVSKR